LVRYKYRTAMAADSETDTAIVDPISGEPATPIVPTPEATVVPAVVPTPETPETPAEPAEPPTDDTETSVNGRASGNGW
jgi:hypothetical protein